MNQNFYTITQEKNGFFTAKLGKTTLFRKKKDVTNLQQFGSSLLVTFENGKHDLYLPTWEDYILKDDIVSIEVPCLPAIRDIVSYQYSNLGIFLLRKEGYCMLINPQHYMLCRNQRSVSDLYTQLRQKEKSIPKFEFSEKAFVKEFFFCNALICNIDNTEHFLEDKGNGIFTE